MPTGVWLILSIEKFKSRLGCLLWKGGKIWITKLQLELNLNLTDWQIPVIKVIRNFLHSASKNQNLCKGSNIQKIIHVTKHCRAWIGSLHGVTERFNMVYGPFGHSNMHSTNPNVPKWKRSLELTVLIYILYLSLANPTNCSFPLILHTIGAPLTC